jgi:hypothetical protein
MYSVHALFRLTNQPLVCKDIYSHKNDSQAFEKGKKTVKLPSQLLQSSTDIQCFLYSLQLNYCLSNLIEINAYIQTSVTPRYLTMKDFFQHSNIISITVPSNPVLCSAS